MVQISGHARRQMAARGVSEEDVLEVLHSGEVSVRETDDRFGTKYQTRLRKPEGYLVVVWHYGKRDEQVVITAFWRR